MQEDTPSPSPSATPEPAAPATNPREARLAASIRNVRAGIRAIWAWPTGRWPTPTITVLLVASVVLVAAVDLVPRAISDVTLSVRARTEVIELDLDPQRKYVWWLPAGSYSLIGKAGTGCEQRDRFDVACTYGEPTAITITNGATVQLELIAPAGDGAVRFSAAIKPRAAAPDGSSTLASPQDGTHSLGSVFEVRNAGDELLFATHDLATFESGPVDLWRIPLILRRVQIGAFLSESISTADTLGAARQPIMTDGDVRIFARSIGGNDRYQIQQERFDPADVVQIPADAAASGVLLGLLSLDGSDDEHSFDVTMHTALAEVFVRRLGAEHRIGVSMWSIVSQLPTWTALWVVWVSLIVVSNYHAARLQQLQGEP